MLIIKITLAFLYRNTGTKGTLIAVRKVKGNEIMQRHFRQRLSYVSYPHFFLFLRRLHIRTYTTIGFILRALREPASVRADVVKLARRCFSPRNSGASSFFTSTSHLRPRIPSDGHANSIVNWIVSSTSNLSLIRCGARRVQILELLDITRVAHRAYSTKNNAVKMDTKKMRIK